MAGAGPRHAQRTDARSLMSNKSKPSMWWRMAAVFALISVGCVSAAEYFVCAATGDDGHDGVSPGTAFATVQRGLDALAPGDVLILRPGEYFETAGRAGLGDAEVETVVRAEIAGTAILRGDVPAPEFEAVEGMRFVYAAAFDREPLAVIEHDTLSILRAKASPAQLEFEPGGFYYDAGAGMLFVAPSDLRPPAGRKFTVSVLSGSGLYFERPVRVAVEGVAATGFCGAPPGSHYIHNRAWGIAMHEPVDCRVRNVTVFLNQGGVGMDNGRGNVMDACLAFGNHTHNLFFFGGPDNRDNVIENSYAYRAGGGMHFYGRIAGPVTLRDNIAWGHGLDFSNKSGSETAAEFGLVERSVGLGDFQAQNVRHSVVGGLNEYDRRLEDGPGNIFFQRESFDLWEEFADPHNMDFRLQAESRFRGKDGGPDHGPFPYEPNVFYLAADGDDAQDGLSVRSAWRTLAAALEKLRPGDTLYIGEGTYGLPERAGLGGEGGLIRVLGRGTAVPVLRGDFLLEDATAVEFARVAFDGAVRIRDGTDVVFRDCRFANGGLTAEGGGGLDVGHCLFAGSPLRVRGTESVQFLGNLFFHPAGVAVEIEGPPALFADYNAYSHPDAVRGGAGGILGLRALQEGGEEPHSVSREVAVIFGEGLPVVADEAALRGWGPFASAFGPHDERYLPPFALAGPYVHSVEPTLANIEWWASGAEAFELRWGETPEMERKIALPAAFQYGGYTLDGLRPGTTYHAAVTARGADGEVLAGSPAITFTTAETERAPVVYHVRSDGSDQADGTSPQSAFRTIGRAAAAAGSGDVVEVGGGRYAESVWVRAGGTQERPITFRSAPGEKVELDTFQMIGKRHLRFDGFHTRARINALLCDDLRFTRIFATGPLLFVRGCRDVVVRNCVATQGYPFEAIHAIGSPGFLMENNVILRPSIMGVLVENTPDQPFVIRRNIFTDSIPFKARIGYLAIGRAESVTLEDNCFYMRAPDVEMDLEKRNIFQIYGDEAYDRAARVYGLPVSNELAPSRFAEKEVYSACLDDWEGVFGETGSFFANPRFAGAADIEIEPGERIRSNDLSNGFLLLEADRLLQNNHLDFPDLFATDPRVTEAKIGLIPEAFEDFHSRRNPAAP